MSSLAALGRPLLIGGLGFAFCATLLSAFGAVTKRPGGAHLGARALYAAAAMVAGAAIALLIALGTHNFAYEYVTSYSSRSLSGPYLYGALWGGMEGSLLLWTVMLTGFSAIAIRGARRRDSLLAARATSVLGGIAVFFLILLVWPADPFTTLADVPSDGRGLNPLLQSPGMLIHPPLLYAGFVGFSVPFAFAMAALWSGHLTDEWFRSTRRWTLFAWSALSVGIVLGGAWAYTELGWGGYWAWDPVENASFMPWLTATAFLHSVVIQEKRRMFKLWNVTLILMTYGLAVFGTFLTRSGILSSVHTFTEGPIGRWFLPFLAAMLIGGLVMIALRLGPLRSENRFDSLMSRESMFLINNFLFVAAALTVLWGTIYPIVAELVTGTRLSVGPPFFNSVFVPLGLALIGLTGIGPLISWRRMSRGAFWRVVRVPLAAGVLTSVGLAAAGVRSAGALLAFSLCMFTAVAVISEFGRAARIGDKAATGAARFARTVGRNRRRYGGYVVHLGVVLIVIGFAGSAFRSERQVLLDPGASMAIGDYTLTYAELERTSTPEKERIALHLEVERKGDSRGVLVPQRNFHRAQRQWQSEVAIDSTPIEDLYVVVTSFDRDGTAAVRAFINPLTWWIWVGASVMVGGMAFIFTAERRAPVEVTVAAPAARPVPIRT
ncbi:MAG TPA: heme lyase CcmF/NrfE family subunit [Actinomycetota bacterium]|nr:heme lyase CcmF/NrfE family subunit [Actinomycetota bacterium]